MTDAPASAPAGVPDDLSFEDALAQLETIVNELERGQAPLERSIEIYEQGAALKTHCQKRLEAAKLKVDKIMLGADGAPRGTEPAEFG